MKVKAKLNKYDPDMLELYTWDVNYFIATIHTDLVDFDCVEGEWIDLELKPLKDKGGNR